jgi:hypothetical protein
VLHPPDDRDMINLDAPLGQTLLYITVGEPEARDRPSGEVPLEWSCSRRPPPEGIKKITGTDPGK